MSDQVDKPKGIKPIRPISELWTAESGYLHKQAVI